MLGHSSFILILILRMVASFPAAAAARPSPPPFFSWTWSRPAARFVDGSITRFPAFLSPSTGGVDGDAPDLVLAGHRYPHLAAARLPLDLHLAQLFLQFFHVLLHELRLLHQPPQSAFHIAVPPIAVSCEADRRQSAGLMEASTTRASKFSTNSRTNGSSSMAAMACSRCCWRARSAMAAGVLPVLPATLMTRRSDSPKCSSSAASGDPELLFQQPLVRLRDPQLDARRFPLHELAMPGELACHALTRSCSTSSGHAVSAWFFFDSGGNRAHAAQPAQAPPLHPAALRAAPPAPGVKASIRSSVIVNRRTRRRESDIAASLHAI